MNLLLFGVICLALNALAHLLQTFQIRQDSNAPTSDVMGVDPFVLINGGLVILVGLGLEWARWPALIFPLIGGLGLTATFRNAPGSRSISIAIIVLDIFCVLIFGYRLFLA